MFRGREMYHPERGRSLLLRLADDVKDLAMIESDPLQDGRNMVMMLAPHKEAVAAKPASEGGDEAGTARARREPAPSRRRPQPRRRRRRSPTSRSETPSRHRAAAPARASPSSGGAQPNPATPA